MTRYLSLSILFVVVGCGGGEAKPPTSPASGKNAAVVNACNGGDYGDHTDEAQGTHVKWDESIVTSNDRCIKVRVGSTVTFDGDFAKHPLTVSGGDANNPLAGFGERIAKPGTPEEYAPTKFEKTGVFGYACPKHPEMKGAILVVP